MDRKPASPLNHLPPAAVWRKDGCCARTPTGALLVLLLSVVLLTPLGARSQDKEYTWSLGAYGGQYYDTEPAGIINGRAGFVNHYMVALNGSKTLWRAQSWPLRLEIDGVIAQQFGVVTSNEIAVAPVLRWTGFPWNKYLPTSFGAGPLGVSYTTVVSPLEKNVSGEGSKVLNFLMLELAFSSPNDTSKEVFVRLHHRCTIYDLLNNYGANGDDFLTLGYRVRF